MNRACLMLLLLLVVPALAPTAMGVARNADAEYRFATGVVSTVDVRCQDRETAVNGVCFSIYPGDKHVTLTIRDASERNIAAEYSFHDGDVTLASGSFCHSSALIPVPKGARTIVLVLGEPGKLDDTPLPGCQLQRGIGGFVNAVFR